MTNPTVHSGRWTRDDRAESIYQYLPIEVPDGAAGLEVTLSYDASAGVIDMGCTGPDGFRGWSGGARSRYAITPERATPGYLAGRLEGGTWHVILGLHRVGPEGVDYEVRASVGTAEVETPRPVPLPPDRPPRRDLPAPQGMRWYAGDFHAHTLHSDGSLEVAELAALAVREGLDFLAVTDHNTTSHFAELPTMSSRYGIALVPGQEVTTDTGHANAFGHIDWVDFRNHGQTWVDHVAQRGGLLSINHPLAADCAWRYPLQRRPRLAEVWHSSWFDTRWGAPISWWQAWDLATIPIAGSDFHKPDEGKMVGTPTTWVLAEDDSVDAILAAVQAGRTAITAQRAAPALLRIDGELLALDADGTLLVDRVGRRTAIRGDRARLPAAEGPYRIDDHEGGVVAICS